MARRRGFFAELNYQAQQAEKRRRQQEAAAQRASAAATREAERAQRAYERAQAAAARASEADRKAAEKEAARLHVEARLAEVEELNANLAAQYADIDGLLAATLEVDDFVDLQALKIGNVEHPPFDAQGHDQPTPRPETPALPPAPVYAEPAPSKSLFGAAKKHAKAVAEAQAAHADATARWEAHRREIEAWEADTTAKHAQYEADRLSKLNALQARYDAECAQRSQEVEDHNKQLDDLISGLAFDVESAINDYVGIVLSNSVYPEAFTVVHDYALDTRELSLTVTVPGPAAVPTIKEHKYVKARDEIATTALPVREQKERYAGAVWQVAVRTLHEVFEADRAGKIHSIALTVGVDTIAQATGRPVTIPLVVVAAGRETFTAFDLSNVVPKATLEHLGAALSKSPFDLTPADTSRGVRGRGPE